MHAILIFVLVHTNQSKFDTSAITMVVVNKAPKLYNEYLIYLYVKRLYVVFPFTVKDSFQTESKLTQQNHGLNNLKKMELIWYIAILCVVKSCYADFFSDLDKLDIDAQLHEIDIMLEKLDDESDDLVDDDSDTFDGFTGGPCKFKCKKGKYKITNALFFI